MTTPMAIAKCFRFSKNIHLRSLIQLNLNPIATANSIETASESQSKSKLHLFENITPNLPLRNDVAAALRNQIGLAALCGGEKAKLLARGRAVKIDDEFNEEDVEDDSDEFEDEDEDEDEFDEMDGEDCDDEDEDEDPGYKKRK